MDNFLKAVILISGLTFWLDPVVAGEYWTCENKHLQGPLYTDTPTATPDQKCSPVLLENVQFNKITSEAFAGLAPSPSLEAEIVEPEPQHRGRYVHCLTTPRTDRTQQNEQSEYCEGLLGGNAQRGP